MYDIINKNISLSCSIKKCEKLLKIWFVSLVVLCLFIGLFFAAIFAGLAIQLQKSIDYNLLLVPTFARPNRTVPAILLQTYRDVTLIPKKVYQNIQKYAPDFTHIIYDDNQIIAFLKTYYTDLVVTTFQQCRLGAHKGDLFRYCYLYINGGVYMDIKTELLQPLASLLNPHVLTTVLSVHKNTIY